MELRVMSKLLVEQQQLIATNVMVQEESSATTTPANMGRKSVFIAPGMVNKNATIVMERDTNNIKNVLKEFADTCPISQ